MTTLADLTSVFRSKNAGPFLITIDLMFPEQESYERVLRSGDRDVEDSVLPLVAAAASAQVLAVSEPRHVGQHDHELGLASLRRMDRRQHDFGIGERAVPTNHRQQVAANPLLEFRQLGERAISLNKVEKLSKSEFIDELMALE